jgi:basic membrane protein A
MKGKLRLAFAVLGASALLISACSDDSDSDSTTTSAAEETTTTINEKIMMLDADADGDVQFGVAAAGPANDGAYVQATVDGVKAFAEANGLPEPIVVDEIEAEQSAEKLEALAQQGADVIVVAASEIAGPLDTLTETYADIFWYCNCGAGYGKDLPGLAQTLDDSSEINYTAGYATGLLLADAENKAVTFLGCCDLPFEKEAYLAYELGLKDALPEATFSYVATGGYPYDFANTAGATEAYNSAKAAGLGAVNPYLDGAHEAIVQLANADGIVTMSAGKADACERTDLSYQIAVKFDGGDYIIEAMNRIAEGTFSEGEKLTFHPGDSVGPGGSPGAVICDPTDEQQAAMDAVYAKIQAGEMAAQFGAIKGQAYAG